MELKDVFNLISSVILSGTAIWATFHFSKANKTREDDKMMKELFKEFNARYAEINGSLSRVMKPQFVVPPAQVETEKEKNKAIIVDYFNLCAEEYFWYKKGRIDKKVWESWSHGMNYWYNHSNPLLRDLWKAEIKKKEGIESYYIENGDEFFKDKK